MKVLVTGAGGFLGKRVCELLTKKKYQWVIIDRKSNNLLSKVTVGRYSNDRFDVIIHMAGITSLNKRRIHGTYNDNVIMAKNMAKIFNNAGANKMIFVSSNAVNYRVDSFARSKRRAEEILIKEVPNLLILRPKLIVGEGSPEVKLMHTWLKRLPFIPYLIYPGWQFDPVNVDQLAERVAAAVDSKEIGVITVSGNKVGIREFLLRQRDGI
ncbi:NAD-dependent epimerase/dehydratase family protein [Candidatus Shapirobacteria bacterium]|nr:NAD-dependent epimerase/dehydratase family protein [Candidatus Shapirobacteria bacterium]